MQLKVNLNDLLQYADGLEPDEINAIEDLLDSLEGFLNYFDINPNWEVDVVQSTQGPVYNMGAYLVDLSDGQLKVYMNIERESPLYSMFTIPQVWVAATDTKWNFKTLAVRRAIEMYAYGEIDSLVDAFTNEVFSHQYTEVSVLTYIMKGRKAPDEVIATTSDTLKFLKTLSTRGSLTWSDEEMNLFSFKVIPLIEKAYGKDVALTLNGLLSAATPYNYMALNLRDEQLFDPDMDDDQVRGVIDQVSVPLEYFNPDREHDQTKVVAAMGMMGNEYLDSFDSLVESAKSGAVGESPLNAVQNITDAFKDNCKSFLVKVNESSPAQQIMLKSKVFAKILDKMNSRYAGNQGYVSGIDSEQVGQQFNILSRKVGSMSRQFIMFKKTIYDLRLIFLYRRTLETVIAEAVF